MTKKCQALAREEFELEVKKFKIKIKMKTILLIERGRNVIDVETSRKGKRCIVGSWITKGRPMQTVINAISSSI